MGRMGFHRPSLFSWDHFAGHIDDVLEEISRTHATRWPGECKQALP
jgi:hypothetical protein